MNPERSVPDVVLDVYFDDRLIQSIRLDPALFSQTPEQDGVAAVAANESDRVRQVAYAELVPTGKIRLDLLLKRRQQNPSGYRMTVAYDDGQRVVEQVLNMGRRTTYSFSWPDGVRAALPDDPHVTE